MIELYLAAGPRDEVPLADLGSSLARLPGGLPLTWVGDAARAWLAVHLAGAPTDDFTVWADPPGGALPVDDEGRLRWLATVHGAVQRAVAERLVLLPAPYRVGDPPARLTEEGLDGLIAAATGVPERRWHGAARGAIRLAGGLIEAGRLGGSSTAERLMRLVDGPMWASSDRLQLQQAAWHALGHLPDPRIRALLVDAQVAHAVGSYAAAAGGPAPAVRQPHADWLVPADRYVACFLRAAAFGALGATE